MSLTSLTISASLYHMPKTFKLALGAVAAILVAAAAFATIAIATSSPRSIGSFAAPAAPAVAPSQKYAQNRVPDYTNFAFSLGSAMGAPDFAIASNIAGSTTLGDSICTQLRTGATEIELATRMTGVGSGQYRLTSSGAASVVDAAKIFICSGGTHS